MSAAPPAGTQAPGWYRYKVGSIEVTVVTDGARAFPLSDTFVRNVPKAEVNKALEAGYTAKDNVWVPYTPIVVNTGAKLVVVDTGLGQALFAQSKGAVGQFGSNLAAAGIDRNQVDTVIISHFHGDHINGLLMADNKPTYPNAEIMVPAAEWKYFTDDGEMSKAAGNALVEGAHKNARRVFDALGRKVTQYEPGKELVPGITSMATYGHTPGHTSHVIASGNAKVLVQADVSNTPTVRAQSGLAHPVRHGRPGGGSDAPQALRHARCREDDDPGLPLSVPVARLYREGRHRLPGGPGSLEPDHLSVSKFRIDEGRSRESGLLFGRHHDRHELYIRADRRIKDCQRQGGDAGRTP